MTVKNLLFIIYILAFITLTGCGPREIGQDTSYTPPVAGGKSTAEIMRYPMTGINRTQMMLYHQNRPEVMEMIRRVHESEFKRSMGIQADPEHESYRAVPREHSPFRQ